MKGIVLAGGTGSRLFPLTKITNKHLLPIFDKPMIYYPIQTLVDAGITDIMVVTGGKNSGDFLRLLANGKHFGLKFTHRLQFLIRKAKEELPTPSASANTSPTGSPSASSSATILSRKTSAARPTPSGRRDRAHVFC